MLPPEAAHSSRKSRETARFFPYVSGPQLQLIRSVRVNDWDSGRAPWLNKVISAARTALSLFLNLRVRARIADLMLELQ